MTIEEVMLGLNEAGGWIVEVVSPGDEEQPHIQYMLSAIDEASDMLIELKKYRRNHGKEKSKR